MCTVTFIPNDRGYLLAMNRDDLFARATSQPLARAQVTGLKAVYPQEPSGGTWIGVNQQGIAFTLLNWAVPVSGVKQRSRGIIIPQILAAADLDRAHTLLRTMDLNGIHPFRLIGFFPQERAICEWRWNGMLIVEHSHEWINRHWFSSGSSDQEAERVRGAVCRDRWQEPDAGTPEWVERLHASHEPEQGAFSICAHRSAGGTLSYTQIDVSDRTVSLAYSPVSPCRGVSFAERATLDRDRLVHSVSFV